MKNYPGRLMVLLIFLLLPLISEENNTVLATNDLDQQYHDLKGDYYDLSEKYFYYREKYIHSQDYDYYPEWRYEMKLRELDRDFSDLKEEVEDLIDEARDSNSSEELIDDLKDLRGDVTRFENKIEDLLEESYSDSYYYDQYYYDLYGYYVKEQPKAPEPKVTVEPLNVYFAPASNPVAASPAVTSPETDWNVVWLGIGIIIVIAAIILLTHLAVRKKR